MGIQELVIGLTTCALLGGLGCGSAAARQGKQGPALRTTVTELDERTRADRRKIDDLEAELSSLKLRVVEAEANPVPSLPVEVRAPRSPAPEEATPVDPSAEEYGQVVGVDENGVEIVYMGDAARQGSVTPRLPGAGSYPPAARSYPTGRPTIDRQMAGTPAGTPAGSAGSIPDVPSDVSDRLPVTDGVGPTVAQRVQSATPPVAPLSPPVIDRGAEPPPVRAPAHARSAEPRTRRPSPPPRRMAPAGSDPAKVAYDEHLASLQAGDHEAAVRGFQALLEEFPDHDLADNAQYWLGESLYDRKLYREALAAFGAVMERYPRGNKVPDALLKLGFCHLALDEKEQARAALARVIDMFPRSHPAALAAERLESLAE
ncbi:MAG TPA: tol-pal system protein YbgF [Haliangium sp.]|nr:tol-pal system protein YbgF [Haliangium sp.]